MKYSDKAKLYLPDDLHAKAEQAPNFPPTLSNDVVAKGERVDVHPSPKYRYWWNDELPHIARGDSP